MSQHIVPRSAYVALLVGGVLVWVWELALALLGSLSATWSILFASAALTVFAYIGLIWHERH
ncbi:MAG: hypothetical protein CXZ00_00140 [Acidobacteria bacterium]|nr:MAG: hypothetical protein CXZ00_00140 [Acidobacteriota bacterium]